MLILRWGLSRQISLWQNGINPEGQINTDEMQPVSYLRKTFTFDGNAKDARAYVSAHGIYEVRINGKRVGVLSLLRESSSYDKQMPIRPMM